MLVKVHNKDYEEDFGMLENGIINFFEHGRVQVSDVQVDPVIRVSALWIKRPIHIKCDVADTIEKKKLGLKNYKKLGEDQGMYFPYPGLHEVTFHQGGVPFPLDLMFLRDNEVIQVQSNTKVGGKVTWSCVCDGVIEVAGGYCGRKNIACGDKLMYMASSQRDIEAFINEEPSENLVREIISADILEGSY